MTHEELSNLRYILIDKGIDKATKMFVLKYESSAKIYGDRVIMLRKCRLKKGEPFGRPRASYRWKGNDYNSTLVLLRAINDYNEEDIE